MKMNFCIFSLNSERVKFNFSSYTKDNFSWIVANALLDVAIQTIICGKLYIVEDVMNSLQIFLVVMIVYDNHTLK